MSLAAVMRQGKGFYNASLVSSGRRRRACCWQRHRCVSSPGQEFAALLRQRPELKPFALQMPL